jgi:ferredoxin
MLKKIRLILAVFSISLITLLFLDVTGAVHLWFSWLAKIQLIPAILSFNIAALLFVVIFTLVFGRLYCSAICPLGIYQDMVSWLAGKFKKNRFKYKTANTKTRLAVLVAFVACFALGVSIPVSILDPYSAYGRIASTMLAPIYQYGNNLLALLAEKYNSYAFYSVDIWLKSSITLGVSVATFIAVGVMAWRDGRFYCNSICPVGTILGYLSKYSLLKPKIDTSVCNNCGLCARNCKASCIDSKTHEIDYSRCVDCFDCIGKCNKNAIKYNFPMKNNHSEQNLTETDSANNRRDFVVTASVFAVGAALNAKPKKVDGGLALIKEKIEAPRHAPILPPGSHAARHLSKHCTACQLCISSCPNQVLRPSDNAATLMQPEMSYERGYCRPECVRCSEVCPNGAIAKITKEEKSAIQIGHAVWVKDRCVVISDKVHCGNCAAHCPTGAIKMIKLDPEDSESLKIPMVNPERCIGCGACENLCPSRPISAIYVEGHERHKTV